MEKNIEIKEITFEDSKQFWIILKEKFPDLWNKLVGNKIFADGKMGAFQPATMPDWEYEIFTRFLNLWQIKNEFLQTAPDEIIVYRSRTEREPIRIQDIESIKPMDNEYCMIILKGSNMETKKVMEPYDNLVMRWKIFSDTQKLP
ncbi:MAG: hypothetical protein JST81_13055 [Bacteroidetes bacterium]|nr:hypothetical protein [Bacteroidota bacterium]